MKFRATLTDQLYMKDFFNIVSTFARLSKRATINITKDGLSLSNIGTTINTSLKLWSVIQKDEFFPQYAMDGVDEQHNEIWLSFHPEQLATALNTFKNFVKMVKIKLTKKQFPCLSIDIEMAPQNSNNFRRLVHDVPVTIISSRDWNEYRVPELRPFDISIEMPTLKSLRSLCDKMKNLSPTLTVVCSTNADISFIVETDSAMVVSRYFNLTLERNDSRINAQDNAAPEEIIIQVDTKLLATIFNGIQLPSSRMIGNMIQDELLNIKLNVRDNVFMVFTMTTVDAQ